MRAGAATMKVATIRDVAARARVSVASVSRALSGEANVAAATRARVVEAAGALAYVPNGVARSLSLRRTGTVGVVLPELHGEFFSEFIRGLDRAARASGLHLLLAHSHGDPVEAAAALAAMRGRVDGVVALDPDGTLIASALPTITVGGIGAALAIDNRAGAEAMTRHLLALGHRRIAFIAGPRGNHEAADRREGWRRAMADVPDARGEVVEGDFGEASGHAAGLALAARPPHALFAANDMMAIGAAAALRETGCRVPEDIALAGFDDIPVARHLAPALTTMRVPIAELGQRALELLIARLADPQAPAPPAATITPELIVRVSCGGNQKTSGENRP